MASTMNFDMVQYHKLSIYMKSPFRFFAFFDPETETFTFNFSMVTYRHMPYCLLPSKSMANKERCLSIEATTQEETRSPQ